jgi:hypothetical protein
MKITRLRTQIVVLPIDPPILSAIFEIRSTYAVWRAPREQTKLPNQTVTTQIFGSYVIDHPLPIEVFVAAV